MDCNPLDVSCRGASAAAQWFNEQMTELATQMVGATVNLSAAIASAWVNIPLMPSLGEWVGGGVCDPATGECTDPQWRESEILVWFQQTNILGWWVGAFMVIGLIALGMRLMWRQDGGDAREALKGLMTFAVVAGAGTATIQMLLVAGDRFSSYVLAQATGGGDEGDEATFGDGIAQVLMLPAEASSSAAMDSFWLSNTAVGLIIAILLLLLSILIFVVQLVVLVVRGGLLLIMVILLPAAAALAMIQSGKQMLGKYLGWMLALILYKPAAAILYAIAFRLGAGEENLLTVITGMAIFVLSLVMLPALLRLIVPATAAVASGSGMGGLAAAGAGAAGAVGAVGVKSMMGAGGGATAGAAGGIGKAGAAAGGSGGSSAPGGGGGGGTPAAPGGGPTPGGSTLVPGHGTDTGAARSGAGTSSAPTGSSSGGSGSSPAPAVGSGEAAPAGGSGRASGDTSPTTGGSGAAGTGNRAAQGPSGPAGSSGADGAPAAREASAQGSPGQPGGSSGAVNVAQAAGRGAASGQHMGRAAQDAVLSDDQESGPSGSE